jgi:hypothetical protein
MRRTLTVCLALLSSGTAVGQKHPAPPMPAEFAVGVHTYFDFGPPTDYYEILMVRPVADGTSIERVTLTPGSKCQLHAKEEVSSVVVKESVASLLQKSPCAISDKALYKERKNRAKELGGFSGADMVMQVECGSQRRLLRSSVFDHDWFDEHPNTPANTRGMALLVAHLNEQLETRSMEKPTGTSALLRNTGESHPDRIPSSNENEIAAGKYDDLFPTSEEKISEIYRQAQEPAPNPRVTLRHAGLSAPEVFVAPEYSPIAKLVHYQGSVNFPVDVDRDGVPSNPDLHSCPPFLRENIEKAVLQWRFQKSETPYRVDVSLHFDPGCSESDKAK